ncbi:MAG: nitroreductase family protein [Dehalococcoidales bacterium]|nr:nitroreductase family protein [Dehalococcoidales bacterium]
MEFTELAKLIKTRRSVRKWQDKPVPRDLLLQAIELATWAPNAGNHQNWRFYLVENKGAIKSIADAVSDSADVIASWPESKLVKEFDTVNLGKRSSFFRGAPAVIAIATSQYQSPIDKALAVREKSDAAAQKMREYRKTANAGLQSAAAAITYLLLILHQMGLGAVWMVGPMQVKGQIEQILKMPDGLDVLALIPVGYPAENPPVKERKPVSEVCKVIE